MKKLLSSSLLMLTLALSACAAKNPEVINVTTRGDGDGNTIEVQVPYNPQRVVAIDYIAMDTLAEWGLADRVVGVANNSGFENLNQYANNPNIIVLGGLKDPQLEAVAALKPDLIFITGRLANKYAEFSKIAPTIVNKVDYEIGAYKSTKEMNEKIAKIFGKEEEFEKDFAEFDARFEKMNEFSEGKTAIIINIVRQNVLLMGDTGRVSMVANSFGFENPANNAERPKGNEAALKAIEMYNPDYIFVLSKDIAVGTEGAVASETLIEKDGVLNTKAYKNGNIIYLTPNVWYLNEAGVNATEVMISDGEKAYK